MVMKLALTSEPSMQILSNICGAFSRGDEMIVASHELSASVATNGSMIKEESGVDSKSGTLI